MLKGYRTVAISGAIAALGVAEAADWVNLVGPENEGWVLLIIGVVMAALRAMTTTPVGGKE